MAITDTPWAGNSANKLYLQSGMFSSTLKTSLAVGTIDTSPYGISWDGTDTPWCGDQADKMYLQSGQFTATLKDSQAVSDTFITGIEADTINTVWAGVTNKKLVLQSGRFTATVITSQDITSIGTVPTDVSYDGTNTPWCDQGISKLLLQSGQFTATLITSQAAGAPLWGISYDGTNTPWSQAVGDKLMLSSGQFTATILSSVAVGGIDTTPTGISVNNVDGRLPASGPSWTNNLSGIQATDAANSGEVTLSWNVATPDGSDAVGYIVDARTAAGPGAWVEQFRSVTTSGINAGLTDDVSYNFRVKAYSRVEAETTTTPDDTATATPTVTPAVPPEAPEIDATDLLNQQDVRVDIVADNPADVSTIYYQITPGGSVVAWGTPVTGDGSETLTLTVAPYAIYAVAERDGCNSIPSNIEYVTVKAANQFTNIRTALRTWVQGVVGNPKVLWREPNAPQALRPYVTLQMGPTVTIGSDHHGGNDATGVETVTGTREFVLSVQVHGKPADEDKGEVTSIMEQISSSLEKTSIQDTLSAAGLVRRTVEGSGDLSGIGGTQWEAWAFKDFKFGITHVDTDDVGQISTVETPVGTYD